MKLNKIIVCILTLALIVSAVVIAIPQKEAESTMPLAVKTFFNGKTEQIKCWENSKGKYYIFLPGYLDLSDVKIDLLTENTVSINNTQVYDGMPCDAFSLNTDYNFAYEAFGEIIEKKITFVKSAEVHTMYIDTESGSMKYIHDQKGNEESGTVRIYTPDGESDYSGEIEAINGRGNNTWEDFDKKPYSIKLKNEADLLGMGKAQKWILLANAADSSNLRNKIVYDFAKEVGLKYSPDCEWVDLYLNGEYAGLYLLCERNEVHAERINISQDESSVFSLEMLERLQTQRLTYITTDSSQALRIHYPKNTSADTLAEFTDMWQSVENAILSEDGIDPISGKKWTQLIDLDSWARKYLVEEIFGNLDGYYISQYFYTDNGKIYSGPVWDYDKSLGNDSDKYWSITDPEVLVVTRYWHQDTIKAPWIVALADKKEFKEYTSNLFLTEFLPLLELRLEEKINAYTKKISTASEINCIRWSNELGSVDLNQEVSQINTYVKHHTNFLYDVLIGNKEYCRVSVTGIGNDFFCSVPVGGTIKEIPTITNTGDAILEGLYYADTDEPFDASKPIYEDTAIYAKWRNSASNKLDNILKLAPLGVIAVMFLVLLVIEIKRIRKGG